MSEEYSTQNSRCCSRGEACKRPSLGRGCRTGAGDGPVSACAASWGGPAHSSSARCHLQKSFFFFSHTRKKSGGGGDFSHVSDQAITRAACGLRDHEKSCTLLPPTFRRERNQGDRAPKQISKTSAMTPQGGIESTKPNVTPINVAHPLPPSPHEEQTTHAGCGISTIPEALFVWSVWANHVTQKREPRPQKNGGKAAKKCTRCNSTQHICIIKSYTRLQQCTCTDTINTNTYSPVEVPVELHPMYG